MKTKWHIYSLIVWYNKKKMDKIEKGIKFNLFCSRFFPFWREGLLKPNKWRLFEFLVFRSFFSSISLFQTRHMFHQGKKNNNIETTKLDFFKIQIMLFYINYNQHINISSTSYYSRISCSEAPKVTKLSSSSEIIVPIGYNHKSSLVKYEIKQICSMVLQICLFLLFLNKENLT